MNKKLLIITIILSMCFVSTCYAQEILPDGSDNGLGVEAALQPVERADDSIQNGLDEGLSESNPQERKINGLLEVIEDLNAQIEDLKNQEAQYAQAGKIQKSSVTDTKKPSSQEIKFLQTQSKTTKRDYDKSLLHVASAKKAVEVAKGKHEMDKYLEENPFLETASLEKSTYDESKLMLEQAVTQAELAQNESDEKAAVYMQAKSALEKSQRQDNREAAEELNIKGDKAGVLQRELEKASAQNKRQEKRISSLLKSIEEATYQVKKLEQEKNKAKRKDEFLKEDGLRELEKNRQAWNVEKKKLKKEVARINQRNETLKQSIELLKEKGKKQEARVDALQERVGNLILENEELQNINDDLISERTNFKASETLVKTEEQNPPKKESVRLSVKNEDLRKESLALKAKVKELSKELKTAKRKIKRKTKGSKDNLSRQNAERKTENEILKQDLARVYHMLGEIYTQQKSYEKAIKVYEKALSYDADNAQSSYYLGLLYAYIFENNKKAIEYLNRYLESGDKENKEKAQDLIKMLSR